jgi:hypothetical protein
LTDESSYLSRNNKLLGFRFLSITPTKLEANFTRTHQLPILRLCRQKLMYEKEEEECISKSNTRIKRKQKIGNL